MTHVYFIDPQASRAMIDLDRAFEDRFETLGSERLRLPALLPAAELEAIDFFQNFHHLANVVGQLDGPDRTQSLVRNTGLVLPSAACYGVYLQYAGATLERRLLVTVNAACARFEPHYEPLLRLGSYSLREMIVLGDLEDARGFFSDTQQAVETFFTNLGLPVTLESASDSFFQTDSPKALLQKMSKSKLELVYDGRVAIGSINFHRNFFGERFGIDVGSETAFSACFGAGLERWAYMARDATSNAAGCDRLIGDMCEGILKWELDHA